MGLEKTFAVYLGQNTDNYAAGFVVEDGFFCVLEIETTEAENKLRLITETIRDSLREQEFDTLPSLEQFGQHLIKEHKLTSLAIIHLKQKQILTYTHNGLLLLLRQEKLYTASQDGKALTGRFENLDNFFVASSGLMSLLTKEPTQELKETEPKDLIEEVKKIFSPDKGALLVVQTLATEPKPVESPDLPTTKNWQMPSVKSKWIKIGLLAIVLLLISVQAFGFINQSLSKRRQAVLTQKLNVLNEQFQQLQKDLQTKPTQAVKQIETLKDETNKLIDRYPDQSEQIRPLSKKLSTLEKTYGNAQITEERLFFDLSLIDKKARADYLDMTPEYLSVLDNQNKKAYLININNKNVSEVSFPKINSADFVTEYNKILYLFDKDNGLYKQEDDQFVKIVNKDKTWGSIIDLDVFNSNIYLLSQIKDEIYKFTPAEDGYSSKLSYFQSGQSLDLAAVKNMSIDFSVFLLGNKVYKYTAGSLDDFKTLSQLDYAQMKQVYKNSDTDYLYLLDSDNSRVVAINQDGQLIKSIFNPKLKDCRYFGVYQDEMIIFLRQNKLYKLDNF